MTTTARKPTKTANMPADLAPEDVTAVIDSREQCPLDLSPLRTTVGTLTTGDYAPLGLESQIIVERKSLDDLVACCGVERARFERELTRMLGYPTRALVVEATWHDIEAGQWRSRIKSSSVLGSLLAWVGMGIPVLMCGDHQRAGQYAGRFLFLAARKRYRENREMLKHIERVRLSPNAVDPTTVDSFHVMEDEGVT
jgi:ERCC4-type nuclease